MKIICTFVIDQSYKLRSSIYQRFGENWCTVGIDMLCLGVAIMFYIPRLMIESREQSK